MKKTFTTLLLLALFSISASPALAGLWSGGRYEVTCNKSGICKLCDMVKVVSNGIDMLVQLTFAVGAFMIVVGAIMMIISAGNEKRYGQGKKFITNAVIGIFIALVSWLIVNEIFHLITGGVNLPWNTITC